MARQTGLTGPTETEARVKLTFDQERENIWSATGEGVREVEVKSRSIDEGNNIGSIYVKKGVPRAGRREDGGKISRKWNN